MGRRRYLNTISLNTSHVPEEEKGEKEYVEKGNDEIILSKRRDETGGDVIVVKNGNQVLDIPLNSVKDKLRSLYEVRNVRISQLNKDHKDKLSRLTTIMQALKNTSSYGELVSLIDEVFGRSSDTVLPGTVNAYFNGCRVRTNFTPFACSPVCSGSAQPVDMGEGWSVCDKYTILYDESTSQLTIMNNPTDKEHAYIYISSNDKFNGFTEAEKEALVSKGVRKIKVVSYDHTGLNTNDVTDDFIAIETVKIKSKVVQSTSSTYTGWYIFFWVIIAIVIILIIALIIYFIVVSAKRGKKDRLNEDILDSMMSSEGFSGTRFRTPKSPIAQRMTANM
jgi:hypothetical protein